MIPDGQYTAVVDEIEAGTARLELEAADGELYSLFVDSEQLPDAGRHDSAVLEVVIADQTIVDAEYERRLQEILDGRDVDPNRVLSGSEEREREYSRH